MNYRIKYEPFIRGSQQKVRARQRTPHTWISGPDPIDHDKYYAWQKHHAQARFRKEEYALTWEDWQQLWPHELFVQRGRMPDDLSLIRIDPSQPWCMSNVEVVTRREHLRTQKDRCK